MVEVEDVWRLIEKFAAPLAVSRVALADAGGMTLAEAAVADGDFPPFDRSTVDGYAVRLDDVSSSFRVAATVQPGGSKSLTLAIGEAVRIFTGAQIPGPGMQVIMQEDAERDVEQVRFPRRGAATNIVLRGEEVRAGVELIAEGTWLGPAELAILASIGQTRPLVVRPVRVLHFTSGNEIVPAEETPGPGQIRNSNAVLVRALLAGFPVEFVRQVHLPDDEARGNVLIDAADPASADVVLFSGGASVGDFDFVPAYLRRLGFETHCAQVNVRPGKPLIFASRGPRVAFGIPGNPLSHFVCFHLFIARAVARLSGRTALALSDAELVTAIPGTPNRRVTYWPAQAAVFGVRLGVTPVPWNSSGHLAALRGVNALIRVPAQAELPKPGASVQIVRLAENA